MCGVVVRDVLSMISDILYLQPERKQQLRDRVKEWGAKSLKRSVGIVHYIGALFKLKMLPETVLHMCFARLLCSLSDSDSLECFAHLVTFTGKDVDKLKAKVCKYSEATLLWISLGQLKKLILEEMCRLSYT